MKTILVVYAGHRLTKSEAQTMKRYSFNTRSAVKVGDRFETEAYSTALQVVEVLKVAYKYVDTHSGELSNKRKASTKQFEIHELTIAPF